MSSRPCICSTDGKLSMARVLAGHLDDGASLQSSSARAAGYHEYCRGNLRSDTKRAVPRLANVASASSRYHQTADTVRAARPHRRAERALSRCRGAGHGDRGKGRKDDVKTARPCATNEKIPRCP